MLVYKYRGGDEETFQRDLNSLEKNYFWSSSIEKLNDPWETIIKSNKFIEQSKSLRFLFGKKRTQNLLTVHSALENLLSYNKKIGIYSLSKSYLDELLWAHYANSHKGFCIEYDLELLLNTFKSEKVFSFPVMYKKTPPEITIKDVSINNDILIHKMTSIKSKRWEYENEYRIITNAFGKKSYDFEALKSIYFGLRMEESHKNEIFERLKGRNIKYYQIVQKDKTYNFEVVLLENPYMEDLNYLKQIPSHITGSKAINFKIIEKYYISYTRLARITIKLETKITKSQIEWLANHIKDNLYYTAIRVHIIYYLPNQNIGDKSWALSDLNNEKLEITINKFVVSL